MPQVLLVHHTPSPAMQELLEAITTGVAAGARELDAEVELVVRPALSAGAADALAAQCIVLGTPANIGYMSGALKHFFDTIYYPCLSATLDLPYVAYVHGNNSTVGAVRSVKSIADALRWRLVTPMLEFTGAPSAEAREACRDLGALAAAAAAGVA